METTSRMLQTLVNRSPFYLGELANGTGVLTIAGSVVAHEVASIAGVSNLSLPFIGDAAHVLKAVPLVGLLLGGLKMINGVKIWLIARTLNTAGGQQYECFEGTNSALMEFSEGAILAVLAYKDWTAGAVSAISPVVFSYMGFALTSLAGVMVAILEFNNSKQDLNNNERIEKAKRELALNICKFVGWTIVMCANFAGGPLSLAAAIGWMLISATAVFQLGRTAEMSATGVSMLGSCLFSQCSRVEESKDKKGFRRYSTSELGDKDENQEEERKENEKERQERFRSVQQRIVV